jgi:hypothetical protein
MSLAQGADGLEPAEDHFHPFAPPLAEQISRVVHGAAIDRAGGFLREVLSNSIRAQFPR